METSLDLQPFEALVTVALRKNHQARNKPADGSSTASKNLGGPRTPTKCGPGGGQKGGSGKSQVIGQQKGQPVKQAPAKAAVQQVKPPGKKKKGKHHQHDLIVTINLVSN
nr:unnamed protein product [Callosobruchus analis]